MNSKSLVISKTESELIKSYQSKFADKAITLKDWNEMKSRLPEELLQKNLFPNRESYHAFIKSLETENYSVQQMDEMEEKDSTNTDHMPVFSTNKIQVGSPKVENQIQEIYSNFFKELNLNETQTREVLRIISSVRITEEDKEKEETMKVIRRYCTKNNMPPELSNALGIQAMKAHKMMRTKVARNIGECLVETNEKKKLRKIFHAVVAICDSMGGTQYELGCMLIGNDKND